MEYMSTSNGIPIYHSNYRLRQRPDLFLQIEHVQSGHAMIIYITTYTFYVLVSATAKSFIASTSKDNRIYIIIFSAMIDSLYHFHVGLWTKGIIHFRSIDGNLSNPFKKFKLNVLILFNRFPIE